MPVTYTSFRLKEKQLVQSAISSTSNLLARVIEQTQRLASPRTEYDSIHRKNAMKAFITFFGASNPATVAHHYAYIKRALINSNLNITYSTSVPKAKAFVMSADMALAPGLTFTPNIYLCPLLFSKYSSIGTNSTLGTIIHELSHLSLRTRDIIYGMKNCAEKLTDAQKILNADNYKYYAEVFQYPKYEMRTMSNLYCMHHMPPKS
jgi:predicted metallopeptidase